MRRGRSLVVVCVSALIGLAPLPVGAVDAGDGVTVESVCFVAHNLIDPTPVALVGARWSVGEIQAGQPTVLLVHGGAATHEVWDGPPGYSVARALAHAGYNVVAYTQLGYGASTYDRPKGGYLITDEGQQEMLHEVVSQVRAGSYVVAPADACASSGATAPPSGPIVILGHSSGSAIASGYAGRYHDVDGVVLAADSTAGLSSDAALALGIAGVMDGLDGDDYVRLFDRASCERFLVYQVDDAIDPALVPIVCDPSNFEPQPAGVGGTGPFFADASQVFITRTGPDIPVLLAWADHDAIVTPDLQATYSVFWRDHCGCDVETWSQAGAGHAFMWHRSLPTFIDRVESWLAAKGIA